MHARKIRSILKFFEISLFDKHSGSLIHLQCRVEIMTVYKSAWTTEANKYEPMVIAGIMDNVYANDLDAPYLICIFIYKVQGYRINSRSNKEDYRSTKRI